VSAPAGKATVDVEITLGAATCGETSMSSTMTASVNRGKKSVPNPDLAEVQRRLRGAQQRLQQDEKMLRMEMESSSCRKDPGGSGCNLDSPRGQVDRDRQEIARIEKTLAGMSPTRQVDDIVDEGYPVSVMRRTCTAPLTVVTKAAGAAPQTTNGEVKATVEDYTTAGFPAGGISAKTAYANSDNATLTAQLPNEAQPQVTGAVARFVDGMMEARRKAAAGTPEAQLDAAIDGALAWPSHVPDADVKLIQTATGVDVKGLGLPLAR
jgi:hypothetical protein